MEPLTSSSNTNSITMSGLDENKHYKIKVKAINNEGEESTFSDELETKTENVKTGTPGNLSPGASTRHSISFSWTAPTETGGAPIKEYTVTVDEVTGAEETRVK